MAEKPTPELSAIAAALHRAFCLPNAKRGTTWSKPHHGTDLRNAQTFQDAMHLDGWLVSPAAAAGVVRVGDDFVSIR